MFGHVQDSFVHNYLARGVPSGHRREVLQRVAMAMASTSGMVLLLPPSQSVGITRSTLLPSRQRQCARGRPFLLSKLQVRKLGGGGVKARRGLREQKRVCDVGASAGAGGLPLEGSADGDSELEISPPGNPSPQEQEVWDRLSMLGLVFFLLGWAEFFV
jgi:hypothetical protein